MFLWPEQITSKFAALHSDPTDDLVDRLNYVYTVMLLVFMAALTGAKQHFGNPIECMAPSHFSGTWVGYIHDYCFVSNTYSVNTSVIIAKGHTANVFKEQIAYYQWVPYVLVLQALLCYLPKFLWNIVIIAHDVDMRSVVEEAMKLPPITSVSDREKHLKRVANFAVGYLRYKQKRNSMCCSGYHSFLFYVLAKWLYFVVCFCQISLINNFVGNGSHLWGYNLMQEVLSGNDWKTSGIFPRVTFCDVEIAQIGQSNTHTMQCVLMINILNEKLYLALWFWLLLLLTIDAISAVYYTLLLLCPYLHYIRILDLLQVDDSYIDAGGKRCLLNFAEQVLRPNGILLLSFIKSRVNGLIASDLTREIWLMVDGCDRTQCAAEHDRHTDDGAFLPELPPGGGINAFGPILRRSARR